LIINSKQQQQYQEITSNNRSLRRFVNAINSPYTEKTYWNSLKLYMKYYEIQEPDDLLKIDKERTFEMIEDFLEYLKKKKERSLKRIGIYFAALRLFYSVNRYDDGINWYILARFKGKERKQMINDRSYTRDEIKKLLEHADLRMKVAILVMASSGVRVGGLATLKRKDLEYIEEYRLYKIFVYSEYLNDRYYTFTTPECTSVINTYFETRERQYGEKITPESPLIRKDFIIAKNPFLIAHSIQERLRLIVLEAGIKNKRTIQEDDDPVEVRRQRTEIMTCHGLRKFFDTICVDSDMKHIPKEMIMGHKREQGLDRSYYRPVSHNTLLQEYIKVIDELTINEENRLKKENQELKKLDEENRYLIDKKMKDIEEQNKILNQKLIKYNEHVEYNKAWQQKINDITESKIEEQHLNKEYESIPVNQKRKKDSVYKKILEIRERRIKHENDYENLLRERALKDDDDDDYLY
jgi:integrase